jgi:hypothetical protein
MEVTDSGKYTHAYHDTATIKAKKSYILQAPGRKITVVSYGRSKVSGPLSPHNIRNSAQLIILPL